MLNWWFVGCLGVIYRVFNFWVNGRVICGVFWVASMLIQWFVQCSWLFFVGVLGCQ